MHAAPSVSYPVGASRLAAALWTGVGLLALAAMVAWTFQAQTFGWRQQLGWAALAAGGLAGLWQWRHADPGRLNWDGESWRWESSRGGRISGSVRVVIDLQAALLLRLDGAGPQGEGRWLWLERTALPPAWAALRRAVYSPARTGAPHAAEPPAARS